MNSNDYRFETIAELIALAESEDIGIGEVAIRYEMAHAVQERTGIEAAMAARWQYMKQAMAEGIAEPQHTMGGLSHGAAVRMAAHRGVFLDDLAVQTMARALSVNECSAAMKRIVAAPTAGSSGILPSSLWSGQQRLGASDGQVVDALFVAGALGMVMANNATISGAKGGCMAEVGVSTAMAAGALVALAGGTPRQVGDGLALALKNTLGLVCDPIGGYVEVPCIKRNAIYAVHALTAAEMALAGIQSFVPPDQVIAAAKEIGDAMPRKYKETSLGGLATTLIGLEVMAARKSVADD